MIYSAFLHSKSQLDELHGFTPSSLPSFLFDFQADLVSWALRKGRAAIFADCGLGKTPMELAWADQVVRRENGRVLLLTPLAVTYQTVAEAHKFGIEAARSAHGELPARIVVANYERLQYFNPADFVGVVCDESSILKSFEGANRRAITEFMRRVPYRLLATATAAPNDYVELGTSSEALGYLGYTDMLSRFFKNDQGNAIKTVTYRQGGRSFQKLDDAAKWRFKGHAELPFWRWVCSWARAVRRPSDLGYDDSRFVLPPLIERDHLVDVAKLPSGMLFALPAVGLAEQRDERRRSINERCAKVAELVAGPGQALVWCHLNPEGDLLEKLIPGAVQVSGRDSDDDKERSLIAFATGMHRVLITKPKIGALGLNLQNCHHITFFPSHSSQEYYQGVRRCWRFGQKHAVTVDIVTTEGEKSVLQNLQRKAKAADRMFSNLVAAMQEAQGVARSQTYPNAEVIPSWL